MKISNLISLSSLDFITALDDTKAEIEALKPLPKEIEDRILQKFRLDWNYHSNAIEGNQLDYGETVAFLMHGITAKGKTLKDHLDIKGHNEAIHLLLEIVKDERGFSESDIRALHKMILVEPYESDAITSSGQATKKMILLGDYKKTPNSVKTRTGEMHYYASPEETPIKMAELMVWYNEAKDNNEVHPLVLAAIFHHAFVVIHPFDDGNGRMARLLMNLILMQKGFPIIVVKKDDRNNYYGVLAEADNGLYIPLVQYMSELLQHSLNIYLKGAKGEDIEEKEDIDKEIALFKQGLQAEINVKIGKSTESMRIFSEKLIEPLTNYLLPKFEIFNDLFVYNNYTYRIPIPYGELDEDLFKFKNLSYHLNNKLEILFFDYSYTNFKNLDKSFNIQSGYKISFKDKWVEFSAIKDYHLVKNIIKLYNENWQLNEMKEFADAIIKATMQEIQKRVSEGKPKDDLPF